MQRCHSNGTTATKTNDGMNSKRPPVAWATGGHRGAQRPELLRNDTAVLRGQSVARAGKPELSLDVLGGLLHRCTVGCNFSIVGHDVALPDRRISPPIDFPGQPLVLLRAPFLSGHFLHQPSSAGHAWRRTRPTSRSRRRIGHLLPRSTGCGPDRRRLQPKDRAHHSSLASS